MIDWGNRPSLSAFFSDVERVIEQLASERSLQHEDRTQANADSAARGSFGIGGVVAWVAVAIPFGIGLLIALQKAVVLL